MSTHFIAKLNKCETAFHLLVLLSRSDGSSDNKEKKIILDFIENNFDEEMDLIKEQAFLTALPPSEHEMHFEEIISHFYSLSTEEERNKIVEFAMKVVMADKQMTAGENRLIEQLFLAWDLNRSR
ncbi:MAG TPA: TerB family tellurite resistance protein [Bacteroidia bacterium]|nr:TerB family tellurite resistance protein [Bacteroidia bacterium]